MSRRGEERRAADRLAVAASLSLVGSVVAVRTWPDRVLRRTLPGLASAISVVPLFFLSLLKSEFPLHSIALEASLVARFLPAAVRSRRGVAAALVLAMSWCLLGRARQSGRRAARVLDDALSEALGSDYREHVPDAAIREAPLRLRGELFPRLSQRRRYLRHEDLSYGEAGRRNHLDIWHRRDLAPDDRAPVLVQIHGSAWVAGSKRSQAYPLLAHMTDRGWVCVAINYSLAPAPRWPAHIIDVKRALAWVKREVGAYGGDPDRVALTGGSSGGHLTALAALTPNEPVFQPGFEAADTSVVAAVPFYGVYDLLDRTMQAPREQEEFLARVVIGRSRAEAPEVWGARDLRCRGFAATRPRSSFCMAESTR